MARRRGSRNADYDAARRELTEQLRVALTSDPSLSLRGMARAAGVTLLTLKHYFGPRDAILTAVFGAIRADGAPHLKQAAVAKLGDVEASLEELLDGIVTGWTAGLDVVYVLGLAVGVGGPAFLEQIVEPTLQAVETRIGRHMSAGELERANVRVAALQLVAPLLLALIHQDALSGRKSRPLEVGSFVREHVRRFLRAYAVSPTG